MIRNVLILVVLAVIVALPFAFRQTAQSSGWKDGDPTLIIVSPHNEAIRFEFEQGFSRWHQKKFGQPVRIDWRNVGGTTEISRYLQGEYATSTQAWWVNGGKKWPAGASDAVVAGRPSDRPEVAEVYKAYRGIDDPKAISSKVDLFFGGGQFDHADAFARGFAVEPWPPANPPPGVAESLAVIPESVAGEVWRTPTLFGCAISTFGIVYNVDRLKELGVTTPPANWDDLAEFRYFRQVGVTDPTKSGSIAKAFEMLVHQKMHDSAAKFLRSSGVSPDKVDGVIAKNERDIAAHQKLPGSDGKPAKRWDTPPELVGYQQSLERGFEDGLFLIQAIGANARYFTDSATKVSLDVSIGDAAVGMSIDFYGRYQAQASAAADGTPRMVFVSPVGGTSVSCDPISLLRGAPHRELAVRFIEFVLSEDGQRLWTYKPGAKEANGEPAGTVKFALRRLPIRRDFYPSTQPAIQQEHATHLSHAADDLSDPTIDPYQLATQFTYYPRWTGSHFSILRELVRAMCLDSGEELRHAWQTLHRANRPTDKLRTLPKVTLYNKDRNETEEVPLSWRSTLGFKSYEPLEYMREWTRGFREIYRAVGSDR